MIVRATGEVIEGNTDLEGRKKPLEVGVFFFYRLFSPLGSRYTVIKSRMMTKTVLGRIRTCAGKAHMISSHAR